MRGVCRAEGRLARRGEDRGPGRRQGRELGRGWKGSWWHAAIEELKNANWKVQCANWGWSGG